MEISFPHPPSLARCVPMSRPYPRFDVMGFIKSLATTVLSLSSLSSKAQISEMVRCLLVVIDFSGLKP